MSATASAQMAISEGDGVTVSLRDEDKSKADVSWRVSPADAGNTHTVYWSDEQNNSGTVGGTEDESGYVTVTLENLAPSRNYTLWVQSIAPDQSEVNTQSNPFMLTTPAYVSIEDVSWTFPDSSTVEIRYRVVLPYGGACSQTSLSVNGSVWGGGLPDASGFVTVTGVVTMGCSYNLHIEAIADVYAGSADASFSAPEPEGPGILSFPDFPSSALEGETVSLTVQRLGGAAGQVTVDWSASGVAIDGASSGTLTFGSGETSKDISITILDDEAYLENATLEVSLSNATGGAQIGQYYPPNTAPVWSYTSVSIPVQENDSASGVFRLRSSEWPCTAQEGDTRVFTVERIGGVGTAAIVWAADDGAHIAGESSGTLEFGPGVTSQTISLPILHDGAYTGDQTITLSLGAVTGSATVGEPASGTLTVLEADGTGTLQFAGAEYRARATDTAASINVTRTDGCSGTVSVTCYVGSESRQLSFGPDETEISFDVPISYSGQRGGSQTVNLSLSDPSSGASLGSQSTATLVIVNPPSISNISITQEDYGSYNRFTLIWQIVSDDPEARAHYVLTGDNDLLTMGFEETPGWVTAIVDVSAGESFSIALRSVVNGQEAADNNGGSFYTLSGPPWVTLSAQLDSVAGDSMAASWTVGGCGGGGVTLVTLMDNALQCAVPVSVIGDQAVATGLLLDSDYTLTVRAEGGPGPEVVEANLPFHTPPALSVGNLHVANVTTTAADLVWNVAGARAVTHTVRFYHGDPINAQTMQTTSVGAGEVRLRLTGLQPVQTYHCIVESVVNSFPDCTATNETDFTTRALNLGNTQITQSGNGAELRIALENAPQQTIHHTISYSWSGPLGNGQDSFTQDTAGNAGELVVPLSTLPSAGYSVSILSWVDGHEPDDPAYAVSTSYSFTAPPGLRISSLQVGAATPVSQNILWTVQNTTGQDATNIVYYWLAGSGVVLSEGVSSLPGTSSVTVTLTNLLADTTYDYWVQSSNTLASVTSPADSPGYAQFTTPFMIRLSNLHVATPQPDGAKVLWTTENPFSLPVTNTVFYVSDDSGDSGFTNLFDTVIGQTNLWLQGLQPGTSYEVFLVAEAGGSYAFAPADWNGVPFTTLAALITITNAPVVMDRTTDGVIISWGVSAPAGVETTHTIFYSWSDAFGEEHTTPATASFDVGTGTAAALIGGLNPGQAYTFSVQSVITGDDATRNGCFAVDGLAIPYSFSTRPLPTIAVSGVTAAAAATSATITWQVAKSNAGDSARHYVVISANASPFDLKNAVIVETSGDITGLSGTVTATVAGLSPNTDYYFYVQSLIDFAEGHYATGFDGAGFFSVHTDSGGSSSAGNGFGIGIVGAPQADVGSTTDTLISWEYLCLEEPASHYVVFGTNAVLTPFNALIATATSDSSGNALADLPGLPQGETRYYFVQSVLDAAPGRSAVTPDADYMSWFTTPTDNADGDSGGPVQISSSPGGGTPWLTTLPAVLVDFTIGGIWFDGIAGWADLNWVSPNGGGSARVSLPDEPQGTGLLMLDPELAIGQTIGWELTLTVSGDEDDVEHLWAGGGGFDGPFQQNMCFYVTPLASSFPESSLNWYTFTFGGVRQGSKIATWNSTLVSLSIGDQAANRNLFVDRSTASGTWADLPPGRVLYPGDYASWNAAIVPAEIMSHVAYYRWRADGIAGPEGPNASAWTIADGVGITWTTDKTITCEVTLDSGQTLVATYDQPIGNPSSYHVEIVGADKTTTLTELKVAKMAGGIISKVGKVTAEQDPDCFYIRIPGAAKAETKSVKLKTDNPVASYNDADTEIAMHPNNGDLISDALLMVSDDVDKNKGVGQKRAFRVQLGGKLHVVSAEVDGRQCPAVEPIEVKMKKTITVKLVRCRYKPWPWSNPEPCWGPQAYDGLKKKLKECYAQAGVDFNFIEDQGPIPFLEGGWTDGRIERNANTNKLDIPEKIKSMFTGHSPDTPTLFLVRGHGASQSNPGDAGFSCVAGTLLKEEDRNAGYYNKAVVGLPGVNNANTLTGPHELLHLLLKAIHEDWSWECGKWWMLFFSKIPGDQNEITDSKRISADQSEKIPQ